MSSAPTSYSKADLQKLECILNFHKGPIIDNTPLSPIPKNKSESKKITQGALVKVTRVSSDGRMKHTTHRLQTDEEKLQDRACVKRILTFFI